MSCRNVRMVVAVLVTGGIAFAASLQGQTGPDEPLPRPELAKPPQLSAALANDLHSDIERHDYIAAEKLLLAEIDRDSHSQRTAQLLACIGTVYFANQDYLNAAVAWKKSEEIAPLNPEIHFSLAMAYVRLGRPDWSRIQLESLEKQNDKEALYPYWLGRLDYDGHFYKAAMTHFQRAIEIDPKMARAYDNLGLCYFYENQNDLAMAAYQKAIALDRDSPHPSPWPYLNLAIAQQFLNQLTESEKNLREALRIAPDFAKAHFQLGTVLEDRNESDQAIAEMKAAARLDSTFPEPHMALARIYHKIGQESAAREEVKIYLRLRPRSSP